MSLIRIFKKNNKLKLDEQGFTLLELIVSITILVIIIITVYASYRVGMRAYDKVDRESYINQNMRQAWRMISRDLRCAYMSRTNPKILFIGNDKLIFTTYLADLESKSGGLTEVAYYVDNDPKTQEEGLIRELRGFSKQEIAPLVKSFKLRYFDGKNWLEKWGVDSSNNTNIQANSLPLAVEIKIEIESKYKTDIDSNELTTIVPMMSN
jgi:prepilin-type N-terminal cleavage/methylation domain-containing protein